MQLTSAIFRYSVFFFLSFCALVLWGFWKTYYSNPLQQDWPIVHAHGIAMTLWCGMLATQAFLIRINWRKLHRLFGMASLFLFASNVLFQVLLVSKRIPQITGLWQFGELVDAGYLFLGQALGSTVVFAIFYGLAILYRRTPAVHGGFMICTALPLLSPAIDRVVNFYFPSFAAKLPLVAGFTLVPLIAWLIADVILLILSVWDWKSHRRLRVFPVALGVMLFYQVFTANAHRIKSWQAFSEWFSNLNL